MSKDSLTLEKLEAMIRATLPPVPEWEAMLRKARAVEMRVSAYLPSERVFVVDPNATILVPALEPLPTLLLSRPEHEGVAREILRVLGITPVNGEPR